MPVLQDLSVFHAERHRLITGACVATVLFAGLMQLRIPVAETPTRVDEVALQLIADLTPQVAEPPPVEPPKSEPPKPPAPAALPTRDTAPTPVSPVPKPSMAVAQPVAVPHTDPLSEKPTEQAAERAAAHPAVTPAVTPSAAAKAGPDKPVAPHAASTPAAAQVQPAAEPSAREPEGAKPATLEEAFVARVRAVLEANKRYPTGREASQQRPRGQVRLWFVLDRQGALIDCGLIEGSPSVLLDRAALATIRRSVFPPFPPDAWRTQEQHRFTAQLDFIAPG